MKKLRWLLPPLLLAGVFLVASGVGSMTYFHYGDPQQTCASCHEMGGVHADWTASSHSTLHCRNCHGGSLTLDAHAISAHLNRVVQHISKEQIAPIKLAEVDVLRANQSCQNCHPQSYADWQAGGHSSDYSRFFLDPEHNRSQALADDCLRCHGMFYDGSIQDLVTPLDKNGPWKLRAPEKGNHPSIPCLTCHQIHTQAGEQQNSKAHFYDRHEEHYFPLTSLPVGSITHEGKSVTISKDSQQRLCIQCHAPSAAKAHRSGTSDDRTPVGVHEGLSCMDCHRPHNNSAKASCASCHPANSHCGQDVELMDTTYFSKDSKHDIHQISCKDCHPQGRPDTTGKPAVEEK